ncbi:hypothetical protein NKJ13_23620 [Mesorhizobium sp. M0174]|uniref:hypothetical protein n=1 Tax=unclassified Mesorhizobium TaxID=325217 RepID=UPI00333DE560
MFWHRKSGFGNRKWVMTPIGSSDEWRLLAAEPNADLPHMARQCRNTDRDPSARMTYGAESKDGAFGLDVRVICLESRINGSVELNGGSLVLRVQLVEKVRRPFVNAGFRIAYLDLVDDRRTGEAEPYLAREHIRAHDFDERAYLFIRSEKPAFDGCSGATLVEPRGVSMRQSFIVSRCYCASFAALRVAMSAKTA